MITGRCAGLATAILCLTAVHGRFTRARVPSNSSQHKPDRTRTVFSHPLPQLDGSHLKATMVEVSYGPGESSPPHSHPCPVIGYILEGTYRTQVKGQPEVVYKAGETFYEAPNGVHAVSANASQNVPVKFVAYFVCDHDVPLSVDVPEEKSAGDALP
jgi:quercetin dioxygenase-like cupin family protein